MAKKLGVFYNGKEWIMGTDVNNGACCETKEIAEQLLALHNKYYYKCSKHYVACAVFNTACCNNKYSKD